MSLHFRLEMNTLRILNALRINTKRTKVNILVGCTSRTKSFRTDVLVLVSRNHLCPDIFRYTHYTFMHIKPKYENLKMSVYNQSQDLFPFGICVTLSKIFGHCDCEIFHTRNPTACSTIKDNCVTTDTTGLGSDWLSI